MLSPFLVRYVVLRLFYGNDGEVSMARACNQLIQLPPSTFKVCAVM
jgi:hypothetical protein